MSNNREATVNLPSLPDQFRESALALPQRVKDALPSLLTSFTAADALAKAEAMSQYARRIKADTESVNAIQEAKLLIQARLGCLLVPETPKQRGSRGGRGKKASTCHVTALHKNTKTTYRKISRHGERIEEYAEKVAAANRELPDDAADAVEMSSAGFIRFVGSDGNIKSNQNKGVIEWYTPEAYIEAARLVMDTIDMDPASCKMANEVVNAKTFFDKDDDGLAQEWKGTLWLNPPFKADLAKAFVHKLCESHKAKDVPQAVLLTNNNTDTKWWHEAADTCAAICFTHGRIAFYNPAGETASPTNGHTLFYFGKRLAKFKKHFGPLGFLMARLV